MLERRDAGEPMHVCACTYLLLRSANSISSRGDYSGKRRLFLAQVRLRFESGVYSRAASIRSYTVAATQHLISSPSDVGSYHREASHRI